MVSWGAQPLAALGVTYSEALRASGDSPLYPEERTVKVSGFGDSPPRVLPSRTQNEPFGLRGNDESFLFVGGIVY